MTRLRALLFSISLGFGVSSSVAAATCDPLPGFTTLQRLLLGAPDAAGRLWFPAIDSGSSFTLNAYAADSSLLLSVPVPFFPDSGAVGADDSLIVDKAQPLFPPSTPDLELLRINGDGSADSGFGQNGVVPGYKLPAVILPDGMVIASGTCEGVGCWVRLDRSGAIDPSFGEGGAVRFGENASTDFIFPQPDGYITRVSQGTLPGNTVCWLERLDLSGRVVARFGLPGADQVDTCRLEAVPDREGGMFLLMPATGGIEVTRVDSSGNPRADFGVDGKVQIKPSGACESTNWPGHAQLLQPDGKLLVSLETFPPCLPKPVGTVVARMNPDGSLDDGSSADSQPGDRFCTTGELDMPSMDGEIPAGSAYLGPDRLYLVSLSFGHYSAIYSLSAIDFDHFDVVPDAFTLPRVDGAAPGATVDSAPQTITGLGENIQVPAVALAGQISKNGASEYYPFVWVKNGDRIVVRHTAAATFATEVHTVVRVGGLSTRESPYVGSGAYETEFVSVTKAAPPSSGGGGGVDAAILIGLVPLALSRRKRAPRAKAR